MSEEGAYRCERPSVSSYNTTLIHPTVIAALRHFARRTIAFDSAAMIDRLAGLERFPAIPVGELISAVRSSGVPLTGAHAELAELEEIPTPFLTFLKCGPAPDARLELVQVERIMRQRVVIWSDRFGEAAIRRADLQLRWSGIVLVLDRDRCGSGECELESYRDKVHVLPDFITRNECRELIAYCEEASFRRSRVLQRRSEVVSDVVQTRVRSSSSVVLRDRNHPILASLYTRCASLEGVRPQDIEAIQCVRYKRGQKFKAHFDGGIDLPRLTTYLLYLNDDFTGGETYFPMLDHTVVPTAGACLRFPSCDREGRVLWQSEHGGLPIRDGVKYALNIWVRCPPSQPLSLLSLASVLRRAHVHQ